MVRDTKGRFVKGHEPMGGRPKREREVEYYRVLQTRCTPEDWNAIIDKAIADAKRGDAVARKWLADYLIGAPVQRTDVTSGGEKIAVVGLGINVDKV